MAEYTAVKQKIKQLKPKTDKNVSHKLPCFTLPANDTLPRLSLSSEEIYKEIYSLEKKIVKFQGDEIKDSEGQGKVYQTVCTCPLSASIVEPVDTCL